jgi:hypothetical protein
MMPKIKTIPTLVTATPAWLLVPLNTIAFASSACAGVFPRLPPLVHFDDIDYCPKIRIKDNYRARSPVIMSPILT